MVDNIPLSAGATALVKIVAKDHRLIEIGASQTGHLSGIPHSQIIDIRLVNPISSFRRSSIYDLAHHPQAAILEGIEKE